MALAQQQMIFSIATPFQEAIATCIETARSNGYFQQLKRDYQARRDQLMSMLSASGLVPVKPEGSYFVLADINAINPKHYYDASDSTPRDHQFCRWLIKEIGVGAIPTSAFFSSKHRSISERYARFAFCKNPETMALAAQRLPKLLDYQ